MTMDTKMRDAEPFAFACCWTCTAVLLEADTREYFCARHEGRRIGDRGNVTRKTCADWESIQAPPRKERQLKLFEDE